jgi:hypothetical protein
MLDSEGDVLYEYFLESRDIVKRIEDSQRTKNGESDLIELLNDDECSKRSFSHYDGPVVGSTTEYMQKARIVFKGSVIAVDQGFSRGLPGTLMLVEVENMIKPSHDYEIDRFAYVFYPYSRFSILGEHFCMGRFPTDYSIKVGDGVLVATYNMPTDLNNQFIKAGSFEVLFEDKEEGRVINNLYLKDLITLHATDDKACESLQLWGDDLPVLDTMAEQVKNAIGNVESARPLVEK